MGKFFLKRPFLAVVLVVFGLVSLPMALWLDLRTLSDENLRRQASSLSDVFDSVRSYYAGNVVGRVWDQTHVTTVRHDYQEHPGAIPIPATLSIELSQRIGNDASNVSYRFLSDYPFRNRPSHNLTAFEIEALATFRDQSQDKEMLVRKEGSLLNRRVTIATPVVLDQGCVACHNAHPESPRSGWSQGDVRGLQTFTVSQPITLGLGSFRWLLGYFALAGTVGIVFAALQFRLARSFSSVNQELATKNQFLADLSSKIGKYLSPQVYASIFAGEKDVTISTERKKLTVFFSDIKDFTLTTERLQPEEITELLNEYFSEMSHIADQHGATLDKFIGDAMLAFFGDPHSQGVENDAKACVSMAVSMQKRIKELQSAWRDRGVEHPFAVRMGINTGYCNVGNFGSKDRLDYTIIGAEANLAGRLQSIAQPGEIIMSYETYVHVSDLFDATKLEPLRVKGISRDVIAYRLDQPEPDTPAPDLTETDLPGLS
ncbi:MAG: adenylate/guanylate cyclase domain-containing protein, partial [Pseudomonadota bacterium]